MSVRNEQEGRQLSRWSPLSSVNKRWRVLLCIVFVSVLSWLLWQVWLDREPIYKEKPLSYWLKGFDIGYNRADKPSSDESVEAVRQSGTNALPILLHMLR